MTRIETYAEFMAEARRLAPDEFAKADAKQAESAALRKDAERYRWLRAGKARTTGLPKPLRIEIMQWEDRHEANVLRGEPLDTAVDAAMAAAANIAQRR